MGEETAGSSTCVLDGEDGMLLASTDELFVGVAVASVSVAISPAVDDAEIDRALVGTRVSFWILAGDTGEVSVEFELTGTGINGGRAGRTVARGDGSEESRLGVLDAWAPWPMTL